MEDWRVPPEVIPDEQITGTHEADVVVVGLGFSGTAAFRAAAESGADVIAIEQMEQDRFSVYGCDIGHINSKFFESRGVPKVDPIDLYNEMMMRSGNRANPSLIMKFAQSSGAAFDWYSDSYSLEELCEVLTTYWPSGKYFSNELCGYHFWPGTAEFPGIWIENGHPTLSELTKSNHKKAMESGGRAFFGIEAMQLIKDGERVTGVIGKNRGGEYIRYIVRRGVVLAAGDCGGNKQMRNELCTDVADILTGDERFSGMGRSGRGLQMGIWAGGKLEAGPLAIMGGNDGFAPGVTDRFPTFMLDSDGNRYCNESLGDAVILGLSSSQIKRGTKYQLFDSAVLEEDLQWSPPSHGSFDINNTERVDRVKNVMEQAIKSGPGGYAYSEGPIRFTVAAGSTYEQMVDNAGLSGKLRENVLASIERYNYLCRTGRDEDFGKDPKLLREMNKPPYFLQLNDRNIFGSVMVTVGGLVTDGGQNVLDKNYLPIPGLYATGNCCGRRFGLQYSTPIPGISIGIAVTLGREAGRQAAAG